jgi:hypothetical protein
MLAGIDIIWGDIPQSFVVTPVVIIFYKTPNGFLPLTRHLMRHLAYFPFEGAMVPLNLAIGLRVEG